MPTTLKDHAYDPDLDPDALDIEEATAAGRELMIVGAFLLLVVVGTYLGLFGDPSQV